MANYIQFTSLALLGFVICVVKSVDTSAPYFNEGANLSFEKCGIVHKKRSMSSPWIVYLRQAEQGCYGIAISDRTILTRDCNFTVGKQEKTSAYEGRCADERVFNFKKCVKNSIELKNVKEFGLNEDAAGNETIQFQIFNTKKTLLKRAKPICLYNRAKETTNLATKRQISNNFMMLRRVRYNNLNLLENNKNTKLMSCNKCLKDPSSSLAEVGKELGLPSQGLLCVESADNYKDHDLVNFYKGRYFLRGLEMNHPLFNENCNVLVDILPFVQPIAKSAKHLSVLPDIPAVKKIKPFNNDAENLSFPNCGTKIIGRQERDSSEDNEVTQYIFSGYQAQQNGHPWHAKVVYTTDQDICGGTLISRRAVLTAAHCLLGRDASNFEVSIGIYDNSRTIGKGIQTNKPIKLIIHPHYNGNTFHYDIGLLIFDEEFGVTNRVHPICLWNEDTDVDRVAGKFMATVVGFGLTNNLNASGSLLETKMPIKSHKECYLSDRKFFGKYLKPGDNFCAGYTNGTNVGKGDSGGSLAVEKDGRWFIRGVVSMGKKLQNDTVPHSYSLFNDVANYMDWIVENTPDLSFQGSN